MKELLIDAIIGGIAPPNITNKYVQVTGNNWVHNFKWIRSELENLNEEQLNFIYSLKLDNEELEKYIKNLDILEKEKNKLLEQLELLEIMKKLGDKYEI